MVVVEEPEVAACIAKLSGQWDQDGSGDNEVEQTEPIEVPPPSSFKRAIKFPLRVIYRSLPEEVAEETLALYQAFMRWLLACGAYIFKRRRSNVQEEDTELGDSPHQEGACEFMEGDVLLNLGSSWINPDYMLTVDEARQTRGLRYAVAFHDLIPWRLPWYTAGAWELFVPWARATMRTADILLANSKNTREDILEFMDAESIPRKDIHIIRWGDVPVEQLTLDIPIGDSILKFDGLRYALYVGTIEVRKNHQLLFRVWRSLLEKYGDAMPTMVWVGKQGWQTESLMGEVEASRCLDGKLVILGNAQRGGINESELKLLYRNCLFTLYPSRYEGWGLPIAESLSFGKYCIASNAASIPEVAGSLIDYHDPLDFEECRRLAERAIFDNAYREGRENEIREKFRSHSWKECTSKILALAGFDSNPLPSQSSPTKMNSA